MATVRLQIIEGMEAGRIYDDLTTPITIGREDENHIQLNDERISRFHAKIQEEGGRLILTDCQSTNGTRVNGHPVQLRTILPGDQISVGRCTLVVMGNGTTREDDPEATESEALEAPEEVPSSTTDYEMLVRPAYPAGPPRIPESLTAVQSAEFSDVLEYMRTEMLQLVNAMTADEEDVDEVRLPRDAWQRFQNLPAQISRYLRDVSDPSVE